VRNYQDLGTERVGKLMFKLSMPAMILMLLHAMLGILDTWFIAQLGAQPLAAVTLCHPIQSLLLAVAGAAGTGINSLMSRSLGAKNEAQCNNVAWHTLLLGVSFGIFFTWVGFQWMDEMLMLMGAGPNTLEQCQTYLQLYLWAVPGILLPILFSGLVVGEGNTVLPLAVGLLETVLDVFLDSLFIRGFWIIPPLGIRGAATATILSQSVGALLYIFVLRRKNSILRWKLQDFSFQISLVKEIFRVGFPSLLPALLDAALFLLLNRMLMGYGYTEVAAIGLLMHVRMFCLLPVISLGRGSLPIAGFAFGARSFDRLKETVLKAMACSLFLLCLGWYGTQFHTPFILQWFTTDPVLAEEGVQCLKLATLFLPLAGPFMILLDILQVTGMSITSMWLSLMRLLCVQAPLLLLGSNFFGVTGVWLSLAGTDFIAAAFLPGFLRIFWNHLYPVYARKQTKRKRGVVYLWHRLKFWLRY